MVRGKSYLQLIYDEAARGWRARIEDWRERMITFLCESAILFLILYFMPVLGSLQGEARLALAAGLSVIGATLLSLLWDVLCAPKRLHKKIVERLRVRHRLLKLVYESEDTVRLFADLYEEGISLYRDVRPADEYVSRLETWDQKVTDALTEKCSISDLFKYKNLDAGVWLPIVDRKIGEPQPDSNWMRETERDRAIYSSRLQALYYFVEYGNHPTAMAYLDKIDEEKKDGLSPLSALWTDNQSPLDTDLGKLP